MSSGGPNAYQRLTKEKMIRYGKICQLKGKALVDIYNRLSKAEQEELAAYRDLEKTVELEDQLQTIKSELAEAQRDLATKTATFEAHLTQFTGQIGQDISNVQNKGVSSSRVPSKLKT